MPASKIEATYFNEKDYQLQGKNHFEVTFEKSSGWTNELTLLVKSFPLPTETTEVNTIDRFNQQIKMAGKTTFSGGDLVIHDSLSKTIDVEKIFRTWRKKIYNPKTGVQGYAAEYKVTGTVVEYDPNGTQGRSWTLIGCWPSSVNFGGLDYESGGYKDITSTIVYDWAYRSDED